MKINKVFREALIIVLTAVAFSVFLIIAVSYVEQNVFEIITKVTDI